MRNRRSSVPAPWWSRGAATALLALAVPALAQEDAPAPVAPRAAPQGAAAPPAVPPLPAGGAAPPRALRLTASTGWDYAFDDVLEVQYEDGSRRRLGANGGFVLAVGGAFLPLAGGRLETRATIGVKYDLVSGSNGRAIFFGFPLELLEGWNVKPLRFSAGLSLLMSPRVRGSGFLADADLTLRSSLGVVGQAEWVMPFRSGASGSISFGLRYLWQKLQLSSGGRAFDANALGATFGVTL
jgi:hypothetical protein